VNVTYPGWMLNDISVFPVALLENAVIGPNIFQGEEVRGSTTYANNSTNAIGKVTVPNGIGPLHDDYGATPSTRNVRPLVAACRIGLIAA